MRVCVCTFIYLYVFYLCVHLFVCVSMNVIYIYIHVHVRRERESKKERAIDSNQLLTWFYSNFSSFIRMCCRLDRYVKLVYFLVTFGDTMLLGG